MIVSNHCLKACYTLAIVILLVVLIALWKKGNTSWSIGVMAME